MEQAATTKELRHFGLLVGGIFLFISLWPSVVRADSPHLWALVLGGLLASLGAVFPLSLGGVYRKWMILGNGLGWVNTRLILAFIFFGMITPIGIFRRILGKDSLGLRLHLDSESYRVNRTPLKRTHMRNQF